MTGAHVSATLEQLRLVGVERDELLRTAVKLIHEKSERYDWTGIYLLEGDVLTLHNYLGAPTAHTRIPVGRGVCGVAVKENRNLNVPDVNALDNYLSCNAETKSEMVVLIRKGDRILGQIDIDSHTMNAFTEEDEKFLDRIASKLADILNPE